MILIVKKDIMTTNLIGLENLLKYIKDNIIMIDIIGIITASVFIYN